jgi:hypothetical protein
VEMRSYDSCIAIGGEGGDAMYGIMNNIGSFSMSWSQGGHSRLANRILWEALAGRISKNRGAVMWRAHKIC